MASQCTFRSSHQGFPQLTDGDLQRALLPTEQATRDELLERVRANLRVPPRSTT